MVQEEVKEHLREPDSARESDDARFSSLTLTLFVLYFTPSIIAKSRNHHNTLAIFWLNFLLGWSILGWIASLVWALTSPPKIVINDFSNML